MNNTPSPVNSSNIHNTNVEKIKLEVDNMLELLKTNVLKSETVLKKKFEYLFKTSPALFNFILKNHKNNPQQFKKKHKNSKPACQQHGGPEKPKQN